MGGRRAEGKEKKNGPQIGARIEDPGASHLSPFVCSGRVPVRSILLPQKYRRRNRLYFCAHIDWHGLSTPPLWSHDHGVETKAAILFPPLHDFRKKTEIMKVWSPDSRASKPFFLLRTTERERERKLSEARDSAGEKRNENWGGGMAAAAAAQKSTREAPVQTGWGGERPP